MSAIVQLHFQHGAMNVEFGGRNNAIVPRETYRRRSSRSIGIGPRGR